MKDLTTFLLAVFLIWVGVSELTNIEVVWMDVIAQFCAFAAGCLMLWHGANLYRGKT